MGDKLEAREEGFYWVELGHNPPEIAYWERGEWWLAGDARPWQPDAVNVLSDKLVFKPRLSRDIRWHPHRIPTLHSDPPLERRDSIMQAGRPPWRFAVCRRSLPNPEPQTCQSPPVRAGHEHPAEAGETQRLTTRVSPNSGPFRKRVFSCHGDVRARA
jgi:hypothetical protein